jgi:hypothetical protein
MALSGKDRPWLDMAGDIDSFEQARGPTNDLSVFRGST